MKVLITVIFLSLGIAEAYACSCANSSKTFMSSISAFTAEVEVIQLDTLNSGKEAQFWPVVLCKLKIVKIFKANEQPEIVWMQNWTSTDCTRGLNASHIGQRFIVTGSVHHGKFYQKLTGDDQPRALLNASTCKKSILTIENNFVYGEITVNKRGEASKRHKDLKLEGDSVAAAYWTHIHSEKLHPDLYQKMPIEEFYEIMGISK